MLVVVEESVEHVVTAVFSGEKCQHLLTEWVNLEQGVKVALKHSLSFFLSFSLSLLPSPAPPYSHKKMQVII